MLRWGHLRPKWHCPSLRKNSQWLSRSNGRMLRGRNHWLVACLTGWGTSRGWILLFTQGPRLQRIPRNSWMRYTRFWWPWGPNILRRLRWFPISSRMLHGLGARCGRIAELWVDFWSRGNCLRQPSWRYFSPGNGESPRLSILLTLNKDR